MNDEIENRDDQISIPEDQMQQNLDALQEDNIIDEHSDDDEEDTLTQVALQLNSPEEVGDPVNENLANIVNTVWQDPKSFEKMKEKMKTYLRPQNCDKMIVKKCNKEIWSDHTGVKDRTKDLRVQKVQTGNLKVSIALVEAMQAIITLKSNKNLAAKEIRSALSPIIKTCSDEYQSSFVLGKVLA